MVPRNVAVGGGLSGDLLFGHRLCCHWRVPLLAIETRAARTNLGLNGDHEEQRSPEALEAPTVMNVTTALLEMPKEVRNNLEKARNETVTKLWIATEKMNILLSLIHI